MVDEAIDEAVKAIKISDDTTDEKTVVPEEEGPQKEELNKTVLECVFGEAALLEVVVDIKVVLGKTNMRVEQLLKMGRGAVVEFFGQTQNSPVTICANDVPVAMAEVCVMDDGTVGARVINLIIAQHGDTIQVVESE
ncbi:MAG: FliM/FliN family flagellar motor switch protein [Alphaproteobacteria bacterium]|nr:FliM/FliN family flagellar motor switch protein [Alphaproteobacteria bacterium]